MAGHVARVRARLALVAHRRVRGLLEGQYAAVQTGRGIDFNDLRTYVRGDDVKDIDWKATARSREPLVRRYVTERRHTLWLVVPSGRDLAAAAPDGTTKSELVADVAGTVGWLAVRQGDRVGLAHAGRGVHVLPPAGGELHLERLLTAATDASTPRSAPGDLVGLLQHVTRTVRGRGLLLLVTGLPGEVDTDALAATVRRLAAQHEVLAVTVGDLDPTTVGRGRPAVDLDATLGLPDWVAGDVRLRDQLATATGQRRDALEAVLDRCGVAHAHVDGADEVFPAVVGLLERHRRARRR